MEFSELMKDCDISAEELAHWLGVTYNTVKKWEKGKAPKYARSYLDLIFANNRLRKRMDLIIENKLFETRLTNLSWRDQQKIMEAQQLLTHILEPKGFFRKFYENWEDE